ncbi:MAG: hypothetical protein ABF651_00050 [Sporolactobacillus sp.]
MKFRESETLSRHFLANPFQNIPLSERLKKNHSIDLRDNSTLVDFGNGYSMTKPIDKNKTL